MTEKELAKHIKTLKSLKSDCYVESVQMGGQIAKRKAQHCADAIDAATDALDKLSKIQKILDGYYENYIDWRAIDSCNAFTQIREVMEGKRLKRAILEDTQD